MLIPVYLRSFERELEKAKKRGLDMSKIKTVINDLINDSLGAF
jgi:mRNA-degrading endonuclease YafQ of YafQ-DinJ toxin-antitoxin module